jgi:elongation factor 1-alpha
MGHLILETIEVPSRSLDLPLRISVTDISKGSRTNVVNVVGRIESGVLQVGENVISEPGGNCGTVRSDFMVLLSYLTSSHYF